VIDISVDLETFDSSPTAAIASIGAVASNGEEFYVVVNDPEGSWSPQTCRWHSVQEDPEDTMGPQAQAVGLKEALKRFTSFMKRNRADVQGVGLVWTHATFDMPVLESAYRRADMFRPWHYRNCRDLRTLYDLAAGRPKVERNKKHNALEDARAQLKEVQICRLIISEGGPF
jgi:exodeoxyribonuclease VIII